MIRVTLDGAAVGTGATAALPPVSASFAAGTPTLLETEGGTRPTVLSLVASGRMKLDAGSVTAVRIDAAGQERAMTPAELRRAIALIDTPLVAEHSDDVSISSVIKEELALAASHHRADRPAGYRDRKPFGSLSAVDRLGLLIDLALRRPDVEALVITSPERHGGEPAGWWRLVRETAARGIDGGGTSGGVAVLVVTDHATVAHLRAASLAEPLSRDLLPLFSL